jgi:hypothetical protein
MSPAAGDPSQRLRSRARLLEFLKFRVLAAQETFFDAWRTDPATSMQSRAAGQSAPLPPLDLVAFRHWLQPLWPEASWLSDSDLFQCLEQAHRLYVDP